MSRHHGKRSVHNEPAGFEIRKQRRQCLEQAQECRQHRRRQPIPLRRLRGHRRTHLA
jgi:hypothetical protein